MPHQVLLLPGDGIGPEIIAQARKVIDVLVSDYGLQIEVEEAPFGGAGYDAAGHPLPSETLAKAKAADAILLGAVGGPQYDSLDRPLRPERGLLAIRAELDLFANIRPAMLFPELVDASSLKPELVSGLDIVIVRELTGGMYFGEPRGIEIRDGQRVGFNTKVYSESEIRRIAKVAFDIASKRSGRVCSVDKANVLEVSELWREVFIDEAAKRPDIELEHMYVDNAAMQLVRAPKAFDVIATENLFGDILSDAASMLTGSIGMLASASLNETSAGLFEPVHGSAPDIASQGKANPLATILSLAMMLRYSLNEPVMAEAVEKAVRQVLASGMRTADIASGTTFVSTQEMGDAVATALSQLD